MFAFGLLFFEDLPLKLVALCLLCNFFYYMTIRTFPFVEIFSPSFLISIVLFVVHNYVAFNHFSTHYYEFNNVLCYLTLFCWLIPIGLLLSCSANDNVLPTYSPGSLDSNQYDSDQGGGLVNSYFKGKKQKKVGLLSLFRYFNQNYLPTIRSNKAY